MLVKPLLTSIQETQTRPELSMVYDKTVSVFRTKLCQSKEHPRKDVDRDEIHQVMKDILEMAKRSGKKIHCRFFIFLTKGQNYNEISLKTDHVKRWKAL